MKKILLTIVTVLFTSCSIETLNDFSNVSELLIVANEGNYGSSNGSLSVIKNNKVIQNINGIGDVVQSILIKDNKLYVTVNNSHKLLIYNIDSEGIKLPGISIDTGNSSPREMTIVNDKLYFTNWNTQDVKILDLFTYDFLEPISVPGLPESIVSDGKNLYVGIIMNPDYSDSSTVINIDLSTNSIADKYEIGPGPTSLLLDKEILYIARTFYDSNWNAFYGTSTVNLTPEVSSKNFISILDYGSGVVCGGSINLFKDIPYRSFKGGIAKLNRDLSINTESLIGFEDNSNVYTLETIGSKLYVGTVDGYLNIFLEDGTLESTLKVGEYPGDFAIWIN